MQNPPVTIFIFGLQMESERTQMFFCTLIPYGGQKQKSVREFFYATLILLANLVLPAYPDFGLEY